MPVESAIEGVKMYQQALSILAVGWFACSLASLSAEGASEKHNSLFKILSLFIVSNCMIRNLLFNVSNHRPATAGPLHCMVRRDAEVASAYRLRVSVGSDLFDGFCDLPQLLELLGHDCVKRRRWTALQMRT